MRRSCTSSTIWISEFQIPGRGFVYRGVTYEKDGFVPIGAASMMMKAA